MKVSPDLVPPDPEESPSAAPLLPPPLTYRLVERPMEIDDAFDKFEHLLSELENLGYDRNEIMLDPTGGTTPMRIGVALAAMTRGIEMIHQRADQGYVNERREVPEGRRFESCRARLRNSCRNGSG